MPRSKFWKSENDHTSWTEWNIVMKSRKHIDIDKIQSKGLSLSFVVDRGFAEIQILKKVKLALSLELFGIF